LLDAGADLETIRGGLDSLGVSDFSVSAEKVVKKGVAATQFQVHVDPDAPMPHRHLHTIETLIEESNLPCVVKESAIAVFQRLGAAEAAVHGTTIEKVHFHEVGAVDSIVDIVAACHGLHLLGVEQVYSSALAVGFGTVQCAHGLMPVPAPATARLLQGLPTYGGAVEGEMVTPTGAALVAEKAVDFGPAPAMRVEAIGYGSGTRDHAGQPNVLRVLVGAATDNAAANAETIVVVETNIDDMNPELLPPLLSALLDAGARDAFLTPVLAKKGRAAHCVTALCDEESLPAVQQAFFAHSTTLGIRMRREERMVLKREWKNVDTPWGAVRVKQGRLGDTHYTAAPEFEDCRQRAEEAGVAVRAVYEAALAAALKGQYKDA
jgi:hypothetical protein